jgi:glutamate carboxypeptidase
MTLREMTEMLRDLVEIESPAYSSGVLGIAERMADEMTSLGGRVRFLGEEQHLRADFAGLGQPILVLGHLDTVWEQGTLLRMPFRVECGRAFGPGVYDMKSGLVVIVATLREAQPSRAIRVLLTADEEMGTRTGRTYVADAACGVAAAFVLEPCLPDGGVKVARKGLGRFSLSVQGRSAHAGTLPGSGVSAIEEVAHQILRLQALSDLKRGISVNVGVIRGGTRENVVADQAQADIDVRVVHREDMARVEEALASLHPVLKGARVAVTGEWTRPPLEPTEGSAVLFAAARRHGRELGLELTEGGSGGGSDGNLVAALGVPVLDGLGPPGGGAHAEHEHVLLDSLTVRARLLARLLEDPGL